MLLPLTLKSAGLGDVNNCCGDQCEENFPASVQAKIKNKRAEQKFTMHVGGSSSDEMFRRLHEIEQKIQYMEKRSIESTRHTQNQLATIQDMCTVSGATVANLEVRVAKDIQRLEESLSTDVGQEARHRGDMESRLRQLLGDELNNARVTMMSQEQQRVHQLQQWMAQITEQTQQLKQRFEKQFDSSQRLVEGGVQSCKEEARRVESTLSEFQRKREDAELQLLKVIEETCVQLHQEIVQERLERVESHKRLERLLLEAVNKNWVRT